MGFFNLRNTRVFLLIIVIILSVTGWVESQSQQFQAQILEDWENRSAADAMFGEYQVYSLDISSVKTFLGNTGDVRSLEISFPGIGNYPMQLEVNPLKAENYNVAVASAEGITLKANPVQKTYKGYLNDGSRVRLTIDDNFFYGFTENEKETRYFEPLWYYDPAAPQNTVITYLKKDILKEHYGICEVRHIQTQIENEVEKQKVQDGMRVTVACLEVEIALADDWLMFDKYNSVNNVENHNLGVINNVQSNYDDEFAEELMFSVVQIWVSTCETCDPWTSSNDPGDLLDDFTAWAPSGFSEVHDVASLWTDRNFNGPTIGLAWLSTVCGSARYNVLEDFTSNANLLRVLQAHELGHNFSATHDPEGSNTIMAPSVSNTNTWSNQSITQINNKVNNVNCFGPCPTGSAPVANFTASPTSGCVPLTVDFTDQSTNEPTEWQWTFPGGTPSSSTDQNPTVTYNSPGTYDVTLEVTNINGSNTLVEEDFIVVIDEPVADFVADVNGLTVTFTNLSQGEGTLSYLWDFDDGFTSTATDPVHIYDDGGSYSVSLTVSNECGEDVFVEEIDLVSPPVADFSADVYLGCEPLTVQFFDESTPGGNVNTYTWIFDGGTPATSTLQNPVVVYHTPGIFDVELIVENESGLDVMVKESLIEVFPNPVADFGFAVNGLEVSFLNNSEEADSYLWDFGDGNTSTVSDPVHVYNEGGAYTVTLISENNCGADTISKQVVLDSAPLAAFGQSTSTGCVPLTVTFSENASGPVEFILWSFPGGNPSTSDQSVVEVTYTAPGVYDVTLIVGNAIGNDTLYQQAAVEVFSDPVSNFDFSVNENVVDFENLSQNASVLEWQFGDGNFSVVENPVHAYDDDGDYEVWLIVEGPCGLDTSTAIVHIATLPTAGFAVSGNSGCQPLTVQFFNTSSSNTTSLLWEFEGGTPATSMEENPVVTYSESGSYNVKLTAWSEVGSDEVVMDDIVVVDPLPTASFETNVNGLDVGFQNTSQDAIDFVWDFGDGFMSNEPNPEHNFGSFGTYTVQLIASNICGQDTFVTVLELSTSPIPMFTASETQGCIPFVVQFEDKSQNGVESWSWSFPGGQPDTSNLQNPVVTYSVPGLYSVTLKVTNASGTVALVKEGYILVGQPPVADFDFQIADDLVEFTEFAEDATSWFWDFGDGSTSNLKNPSHNYSEDGDYTVRLIVSNFCGSDTLEQVVSILTSTVEILPNGTLSVDVFPNPSRGKFQIMLSGSTMENIEVYIYDALGRSIYKDQGTLQGGQLRFTPDLVGKSQGLCVIHIFGADFQASIPVILVD